MVYVSATPAMSFVVSDILAATNGCLLAGAQETIFKNISIDSRTISEQEIFLALKGEAHDGHNFIAAVMQKKGVGVIGQTGYLEKLLKNNPQGNVVIGVEDTLKALASLARYQLDRSGCSVVAITGTNGKTTTKELTALVLKETYQTHATPGNFNNHIGLPLSMLGLTQQHEWAVFELGMNHKGEIAALTQLCHPSIGVITNVGQAHLSGLGSVENIAAAKGELLSEMDHGHTAVLNMDDPLCSKLATKYTATKALRLIGFGLTEKATVRAEDLERTPYGIAFTLVMPSGQEKVQIKAPGLYMVSNALAAAAVGYAANVPMGSIVKGLEKFTPVSGRMEVKETAKGFRIMNDTYNANPSSMTAAIKTLEDRQEGRRGFVVLGEMLELGPQSPAMHEEIGRLVAKNKMFSLFTYGAHGKDYLLGARKGGMAEEMMFNGEKEDILRRLYAEVGPGDIVLVKGSRGTRMEDVVNHLIEWGDA